MIKMLSIVAISCLFFGCSNPENGAGLFFGEDVANNSNDGVWQDNVDGEEGRSEAIVNGIYYDCNFMSAMDYLSIKGEQPSPKDKRALQKESVLILEIGSLEEVQDILQSEKMEMNKEDAIKYLIGKVSSDITLIQNNEEYTPTGIQYDGMLAGTNKIRLFLFYKNVNSRDEIGLKFYDRLFGAGMINLKHKEINSI